MEENKDNKDNKVFNRLDELLRSKDYSDLNEAEKQWVEQELGNEESYSRLRSIIQDSSEELKMEVSTSVKQSLITQMKATHQPKWTRVLNFKIPAYLLFVLVLISGAIFFINRSRPATIIEKIVEIPSDPIVDTVFVQVKADTVFLERIKEVPVYIAVKEEPEIPLLEQTNDPLTIKSLADQEEIRSLLVRMDDYP